jgi:Domain of unknown function (DUF6946)
LLLHLARSPTLPEPFGASVARTICDALERSLTNARSRGVDRVEALVKSLLRPIEKGQLQTGLLQYQLLTAAAGSLAWAQETQADIAVLVIHEFITSKNRAAYERFAERLAGNNGSLCRSGRVLWPVRGAWQAAVRAPCSTIDREDHDRPPQEAS